MPLQFQLPSSDPARLAHATRLAHAFVQDYLTDAVVGIVWLGAIPRGYFDRHADIDIAIFKHQAASLPLTEKFYQVEGVEIQVWLSDYESELTSDWDMARRWTYSHGQIYYDPHGKTAALLAEKVPLRPAERRWLVMAGLTLSEWYINRLTDLWVERGSLTSAHQMIAQGLDHFFNLLYGLNNELVADTKWRYYCAERLERLPANFTGRIQAVMQLHDFTLPELTRRKAAFMELWEEMKPVAEAELQMTFAEMLQIV